MKILSRDQIKDWDSFTIMNEPISSVGLMERASLVFCDWLEFQIEYNRDINVKVFCGPGNNGGDGLAIARILNSRSYSVSVYLCQISESKSADFNINLERLPLRNGVQLYEIKKGDNFDFLSNNDLIVDGIFGSGLTRSVEGYWGGLINYINNKAKKIFAIDIPSGMFCDSISDSICIMASNTLSFEIPKLSFFLSENQDHIPRWEFRSIGLLKEKLKLFDSPYYFLEKEDLQNCMPRRKKFQHKGDFGHALLVGGSIGMVGSMVLAAKACLRAGAGLVSLVVPRCGENIIQNSVPEAMFIANEGTKTLKSFDIPAKTTAIGIGPGMTSQPDALETLEKVLSNCNSALVIDADALNSIAEEKLHHLLPLGCVLTPHPKEFERLFGKSENSLKRIEKQIEVSKVHGIYIVLKGAYTSISTPSGDCYFNSTGNPGMATGGSGDTLTGILTSLLAQGYPTLKALIAGVFLHGLAGDLAKEELGEQSLIASDIIKFMPLAFQSIQYDS